MVIGTERSGAPETASPGTGPGASDASTSFAVALARRASHGLIRRFKRARKDGVRRVKFAQEIVRRLRRRRKDLYFRARESRHGQMFLRAAALARAPRDLRRRRLMAAQYIERMTSEGIDPSTGYQRLSLQSASGFDHVLASCRRLFTIKKAEFEARVAGFESWGPAKQAKYLGRKQSFLRYLLTDEDLRKSPELVEFALSDRMLGAATRYLGMVPYLSRVDLVHSLPRPGDNIDSQLFHLDPEGLRQVKFFIYVYDVGDGEGPFSFIPADASARVLRETFERRKAQGAPISRRYSDEEVAAAGGADALVTVKGPAGTGVAVDTSQCLHLGSRVQPGTFRLILYLQYCTTREQTNVFDVARFTHNPVHHLAVSHSVEPGRTHVDSYQMAE